MNSLPSPTTVPSRISGNLIRDLARACGFELAGVARPFGEGPGASSPDFGRYRSWSERGLAGKMGYLTDHRAQVRADPGQLLEGVRSIICVGLAYNAPEPYSTEFAESNDGEKAWISRYAWGEDYHPVMRRKLEELAGRLSELADFRWRACVDTAPLLERSYAGQAGLGWIGRNTCLINEKRGSWFFLGELLTTLDLEPDGPPPDRCGTCSRCIEACPTQAIVPSPEGGWELDARLCISYFTIELRGAVPEEHRASMGTHVFGCDICQDVCPWNRPGRAGITRYTGFHPENYGASLERLAGLTAEEFQQVFRGSPVTRAKYSGFLRNVAIAMGNARLERFRTPLERLAGSEDASVSEHARWALEQLG